MEDAPSSYPHAEQISSINSRIVYDMQLVSYLERNVLAFRGVGGYQDWLVSLRLSENL
jgi:hypothetical protein